MKRKFSSFSPPKSAGKENKIRWKSHFPARPLDLVENSKRFPRSFFYSGFEKTVPIKPVRPTHKRPDCLLDKRTKKSVHKL